MLKRTFMILLLAVAVLLFFSNQEAGAVADGNGSCSPTEEANHECAYFGASAVEFLGANDGMCTNYEGGNPSGSIPCSVYFYKYTGPATNQINVAIPLYLTTNVNNNIEIGCSQWITDGNGDPTTGFGKYFTTFGVCRTAPTASSFPIIPPSDANFYIAADRSFFDRAEPLPWAVKVGKEVYSASIVGPVASVLPVEQSGATLTTSEGTSITYAIRGGGVTITQGTASIVPMEKTKLCLPCVDGQTPSFSVASGPSAGSYCCETISYATENCDIKTTGSDPCRYIGGVCIKY